MKRPACDSLFLSCCIRRRKPPSCRIDGTPSPLVWNHETGRYKESPTCWLIAILLTYVSNRYARRQLSVGLYSLAFLLSMLALNVIYVAYSGALTDLVPEHQLGKANGA